MQSPETGHKKLEFDSEEIKISVAEDLVKNNFGCTFDHMYMIKLVMQSSN